jgi:predicted glycoside hydrolase/deacetylase ChbG (UPF0249 family)
MACGSAFEDAVNCLRELPELGVGVHLALLEGRAVQRPATVPLLVRGAAFGSALPLLWRLAIKPAALRQAHGEWRAQIERALAAGVTVTHLDSHKHLHLHPQLFGIAIALAQEYDIWRLRLALPASRAVGVKLTLLGLLSIWAGWRLAQNTLRSPNALLGVACSGRMTVDRLLKATSGDWHGVRELMVHPAYRTSALADLARQGCRWVNRYHFEREVDALCSPRVEAVFRVRRISLVDYSVI